MLPIILIAVFLFGLSFLFSTSKKKKNKVALAQPFPQEWHTFLLKDVQFYKDLSMMFRHYARFRPNIFMAIKTPK